MRINHLVGIIGTLISWPGSIAVARDAGWLVRTSVEAPSVEVMSELLGVPVAKVEQVDGNLFRVETATPNARITARTLRQGASGVLSVQRNFVYHTTLSSPGAGPNALVHEARAEALDNPAILPPSATPPQGADPRLSQQWGIAKSKAKEAWDLQTGDHAVVVAVIDTGVDYNHEDLRNAMWRNPGEIPDNGLDDDANGFIDDVVGWDVADNDARPYDKMSPQRIDGNPGHGTHCAGVIGAVGGNATGISGVAPNISLMALRFITDAGEGTSADAIKAIKYAVANGAKVLSNSWGGEAGDEDDAELKAAIDEATAQGVILIFAAGNGRNGAGYDNDSDAKPAVPASFDSAGIVAVAAIDNAERLAGFSNWGKTTVDLAAPGVKILSTVPASTKYEDRITVGGIPMADWSGTSMATPHVAGAAALLWSARPNLTAAEIKDRLLSTTTPIAALKGKTVTGGMLNVRRVVE